MRESLSSFLFCCRRDFFSPTKGKEEKVREREREREKRKERREDKNALATIIEQHLPEGGEMESSP